MRMYSSGQSGLDSKKAIRTSNRTSFGVTPRGALRSSPVSSSKKWNVAKQPTAKADCRQTRHCSFLAILKTRLPPRVCSPWWRWLDAERSIAGQPDSIAGSLGISSVGNNTNQVIMFLRISVFPFVWPPRSRSSAILAVNILDWLASSLRAGSAIRRIVRLNTEWLVWRSRD